MGKPKKVKLIEIASKGIYPIGDGDHGQIKPSMYKDSGIPYIRVADMDWDGEINYDKMVYISKEVNDANKKSHLFPGDILISKTGATIGKIVLIPDSIPLANTTASIGKVTLDLNKADPRYVFWCMKSHDFQSQMWRVSHKSAQPGFNVKDLKEFEIPLPNLKTQKRIASILDDAQALKQKTEKLLAEYDELAQSIFLDMFGDPVTNPKGWEVKKLGEILSFLTSGSRGWAKYYSEDGNIFLRIQNVGYNHLKLNEIKYVNAPNSAESNRTRVQAGDVLLTITADLGRTAVIPKNFPAANINQHLAILRLVKDVSPHFVSAFMASHGGQSLFFNLDKGGVKAGLNFQDIKSYRIFVPPFKLQNEFANKIALIEQQKELAKQELKEAEDLFNCLLQKAFKGELV